MRGVSTLNPEWPAPSVVHTASSLRQGGVSQGVYASLNLGDHVGDDPLAVAANRQSLVNALALPTEPRWLRQVHGTVVIDAATAEPGQEADAAFTTSVGAVCAVMTADCLPVLLCNGEGTWVAAAHAGWRGLAAGVLENTLRTAPSLPQGLMAWLGPAIGAAVYEIGEEVRQTFVAQDATWAEAFTPTRPGHYLVDMYALARARLRQVGVHAVYGGEYCTYSEVERFFSYRRDGVTGRMASMIWLAN